MRRTAWPFGLLLCVTASWALAAEYPALVQGDYVIRGFSFNAGGVR